MYVNLILGLLALIAGVWLYRWLVSSSPAVIRANLRKIGVGLGVGLLLFLVATGRLNWIVGLAGSAMVLAQRLIPLLRAYPLIKRFRDQMSSSGRSKPSSGQSGVATRTLRMSLDHSTGEIDGEVLVGHFEGCRLSQMDLPDLLALLGDVRTQDAESVPLIEAFLDRVYGVEWRERAAADSEESGSRSSGAGLGMTRDEALDVLGLAPGATKEAIINAHRRLVQRLHPDRGGSSYLAAKINMAKDILLGKS